MPRDSLLVSTRSFALAMLMALAACSAALGQIAPATTELPRGDGEIRGRVVTAVGQTPIANATVEVASSGATAPPSRVSTNAAGEFRLPGLRPATYRVLVRAFGYTPREFPSTVISASSPSVDLGTVVLTPVPFELKAVVVAMDKQAAQFTPDRNTYVVRDMTTTRGGSALDVLRNVPAVDVDIDNIVSLRGNSGVVVQVNGRPSPMKPAQLGNFLAQLPAGIVDKIEVIPNPSARDDPTGTAGIINIVLKQEADAGTSGGLTLGGGTTGHVDVGANAGYSTGPLSVYGSYGFLRDDRPRTEAIYRENTYLSPMTFLEESGTRTQIPLAHTLTASAAFKPGKQDELSTDIMFSTRNEAETYGIVYRDLNAARVLTGMNDRFTTGTNHETSFESALAYKHTFATKGHKFSSEASYTHDTEGGPTSIASRSLDLTGQPTGTTSQETQLARERPTESYVKFDYVRPLSKGLRLETGYKGSLGLFRTTQDAQTFDAAASVYRPDSSRISDFRYDQRVNAGYGMFVGVRDKFVLQGGVRVEHASTQFHVNTRGARYDNSYDSFFPSALVAFNPDDEHTIKLSYSTRIKRPDDTDQLDPTPHFQDPLNISQGNPGLKPEYIRAFELGLQRSTDRVTVQLTPFFRHTIDAVRSIRTIDTAGVATRTFANVATSDAYGTDANITLSGGRLGGFAGASAFRQVSNASNLSPGFSAKTFGWTTQANVSFRASRTVDMQSILSYQGAQTVEQGRNASRLRFSLAGRRKLMEDRLSLTLRVIDPFNTSRERNITIDPRFYQVTDRTRSIRGLLLSANWTFGKVEKDDKLIDEGPP